MDIEIPTIEQIIGVIAQYIRAEDKLHRLHRYHIELLRMIRNHPEHREDICDVKNEVATMIQGYMLDMAAETTKHGVVTYRLDKGRPRRIPVAAEQMMKALQSIGISTTEDQFLQRVDPEEVVYDHRTTASMLGASPRTLYEWVRKKWIVPQQKNGTRANRFTLAAIQRFQAGDRGVATLPNFPESSGLVSKSSRSSRTRPEPKKIENSRSVSVDALLAARRKQ